MKRIILLLSIIAAAYTSVAQTYISFNPSLTNTAGTIADKSNISFELGRQWDVFSAGLDVGKTSLAKVNGRDSTVYVEVRPNLNIFQQGKFTNTFTPGIGFIFNAHENMMTELTSGIEYACSPLVHFNVYFGQYYYSGKYSASTVTFFGVSVMKYFSAAKRGAIFGTRESKKQQRQ